MPYTQYDIPRVPTGLTTVNIPKKIIFNDPATIVYWADGTKTVVKTMPGTEFNEYYGFVCALAKHIYGTNSSINHIIDIASKNGRTE